ncbi:response regulator [Paenibacillus sp. J22TS3]|uniref:response regulator transcription factor n=1 Tax=Paenibacillus sp. J22TS3 TaxID=2807192 RepID=UPI001B2DEDAA|nr:helix-turn-helix domain-containing protein [Paenibacillus sp. J22TS3]GIP20705.1 hypothetical protein J22TS3_09800 [Paenibacillus sp. J22TS3]
MLNLLVIEDETTTREGLLTMIDWGSLGIQICGQAANGLEAWELLQSIPADLLLSDIRMPMMDGLQLVEKLQEHGMDVSCVLLTGYGDFEYAQKALRLGVEDYIIKPCHPREIAAVFRKTVTRLLERRQTEDAVSGIRRQLEQSLPMVKSQTIRQWLTGPKQYGEDRLSLAKQLGIVIHTRDVVLIAIRPDGKTLQKLGYNESDMQLIHFAAADIVRETLSQTLRQSIEVIRSQDMIITLCNGTHDLIQDKLQAGIAQLQCNLERYLNLSVSVGISDVHLNLDSLAEAYGEALQALERRFYQGGGGIFRYTELSTSESGEASQSLAILAGLEQTLIEHLSRGLFAEGIRCAEDWLGHLQTGQSLTRSEINLQALSLLARIIQLAKDLPDSGSPSGVSRLVELAGQIEQMDTLEEISGLIFRVIRQLAELMNPQKIQPRKIQQAVEYINEHYNSPSLSLGSVARDLFVSSTYLSTLFKQDLGVNFLDYVHQFRVERAKAKLQSSDSKVQTIAREVGYSDEAHFTRTFKKWTGLSPSQYRKEVMGP